MNNITYHKWDIRDFKKLKKSCSEILKLSDIQFFQP